jgi:flagellar basal body L-ring protein FlgH
VLRTISIIGLLAFGPVSWALAQSSSLFLVAQQEQTQVAVASTQPAPNGALPVNAGAAVPQPVMRNLSLAQASLTAIAPPQPKIVQVNDLIGIVVRHRLRYQTDTRMQQQSQWDLKTKLESWFRIHKSKLEQQDFEGGTPEIEFKNQNDMKNQGRADRRDVFETRIKGKIIDVKPNGNLVVVGWSRVKIDDEDQCIRLVGECNREDIGPDNTVISDKIYGLDVQTMNDGAMRDGVKRGWFKEFMDDWKPF